VTDAITILRTAIHQVCHDMTMDDTAAMDALKVLNGAIWYLNRPYLQYQQIAANTTGYLITIEKETRS
jgi:hypothetical protein